MKKCYDTKLFTTKRSTNLNYYIRCIFLFKYQRILLKIENSSF